MIFISKFNFIKHFIILVVLFHSISSCSGRVSNHGTLNIEKIIDTILERKLEKAEVEALLGPPTTTSAFEFNKWYYINSSFRHKSIYKPELIGHKVYEIIFNQQNEAIKINTYTKEDLNNISYNEEETETKGNDLSIMQQIFKDVFKNATPK